MAPKKKQEKMSLGNFLSDQNYGSWAEEMDEMPLPSRSDARPTFGGGERRDYSSFGNRDGGFRDFSDRGPREELPLPSKPPFTAHLGNLSFDVTAGDIEDYFAGCEVTNVRIVEDKLDRKPKGFGYVEFGSLDGLKKALTLSGTTFQGRNIRVSVAEPPKDREGGRELNDWSRKGPLPDLPQNTRRPSGRGFDASSDAGSERGMRRQNTFEGDGRTRDLGNWERKGPLSPVASPLSPSGPSGAPRAPRSEKSNDRAPASWGERGSQDGSRPPRKEFQERPERPVPERAPTAADLDTQWRARMRPDMVQSPTATPDASLPSSPIVQNAAPASRPKLQLQKRTVSDVHQLDTPSSATDAKASPFGAARPTDTATREREIAEKREAALQKKKEEDEQEAKAKASRAAADKAANAAKSNDKTDKEPQSAAPRENGTKENGDKSRPTFEILRRMTGPENGEAEYDVDAAETEGGARNTPANGNIIGDKDVKPQEGLTADGETTAEAVEAEGWSTIPERKKKGRGGNTTSRALAS